MLPARVFGTKMRGLFHGVATQVKPSVGSLRGLLGCVLATLPFTWRPAIVYGFMFALIALVIIVGVAAFGAPVKGIVESLSASSLQLKGEVKW